MSGHLCRSLCSEVYSSKRRVLSSADVLSWEVDGYCHQGDLHTFATGGRS